VVAVREPCSDFSQVPPPDRLTAQRTEKIRAGCPAIHQDEFHVCCAVGAEQSGLLVAGRDMLSAIWIVLIALYALGSP
jgi:hypothetical protein